jgi:uncharacterized protein (DUF2267 family)
MQHDEFVGLVQDRARLDSRGAAEAAIRATLETLGDRLAGGLPDNLGAQLPPEIGRHLDRPEAQRFDLNEFWQKVADRESAGVELPQAAFHARAVMSVVAEAVEGAQVDTIRDQLEPDYRELFDFSFAD